MPDIDHMDIGARQENLAVRGEPIMLQLCVVPAYALTIHKTQVRFDAGLAWPLVDTCLVSAWALGLDLRQACAGPVDQASRHRLPRGRLRHGTGVRSDLARYGSAGPRFSFFVLRGACNVRSREEMTTPFPELPAHWPAAQGLVGGHLRALASCRYQRGRRLEESLQRDE